LPGAYRVVLEREALSVTAPDPRQVLGADIAVWDAHRRDVAAAQTAARAWVARHDGQPLTVPRWLIGGARVRGARDAPLLADHAVRFVTVFPDDTIVPCRDAGVRPD